VKYRTSRSTLVPYIEVNLRKPESFLPDHHIPKYRKALPHFIDNVIIGPTPHPGLSRDALRGFFAGPNVEAKIHNSTVPYRDW
jgi:hypothetical protein